MRQKYFGRKVSAAVLALSSILSINIAPLVGAVDQDCTWTGATSLNFNTASNWTGCGAGVPGAGDNLVFDVTSLTASQTLNNDIVGLSVKQVTFQGANTDWFGFTLDGNPLTVTVGITNDADSSTTIDSDIVLSGAVAINTANYLPINGVVSGTGSITKSGTNWLYLNGANTFSGSITASAGALVAGVPSAFGNASNTVAINSGASLYLGGCADTTVTIPYDLTLTGAAAGTAAKLATGALCAGGGGGADDSYSQAPTADSQNFTLSGDIALGSDITFGGIAKQTNLTGALSGNFKITLPNLYSGVLTVNGSSNTTATPNGTYTPAKITATLSDNQPSRTVWVGYNAVVTIDGTRGDTQVGFGGKLMGTGTVGGLIVNTDGVVAPGHSPGCINSGNLTLTGTYEFEVGGTTACTGYDQINVTGTVDITDGTLVASIYNNYQATAGEQYTIINNDGTDAVTGTFNGFAEGATFAVGDGEFRITYVGGDGNDVVLTVVTAPTVPDTGFALLTANPLMTLAATIGGAGALLMVARRVRA